MRHPDERWEIGESFLPGLFCNHTIPGFAMFIEWYRAMETQFGHRKPYPRGGFVQDDEVQSHILQTCPECPEYMHPDRRPADVWICDAGHTWTGKELHDAGRGTKGPLLRTFEV